MSLDDLSNGFSGERLLSEPRLDLVQDFSVIWVRVVQSILQRKVGSSKAVAEVLSKDPSDIGVGSLLDRMKVVLIDSGEERVVWQTVEERGFSDDLVDRVLDRWCTGVGDRVEVHRNDGNTVSKLLDVLSGRVETVEVVQVGQCGKVFPGTAHLETDNNSALTTVFDLEHFNDRAISSLNLVHDRLVDVKGVVAGLFQEVGIGD